MGQHDSDGSFEADLEPELKRSTDDPSLAERRRAEDQARAGNREIFQPRIKAHLDAYRVTVDHLVKTHQWIADSYDFDVVGDTRYAAVWQMAGRCLGLARLIIDSLEVGYTAEVPHLARSLHEADRLLDLFLMPDEEKLLRKWLKGQKIDPSDARKAEERFDNKLKDLMAEKGMTVEDVGRRAELSRSMYGKLSEPAHHKRRWTEDAVSGDLRQMIVGPGEVWLRRAATTASMLAVVEECVLSVGDALSRFMPSNWYDEHIEEARTLFSLLTQTQPLS